MSPLRRLVFDRRSLHAVAAGCVALAAGGVVLLRAPSPGVTAPVTAGPAAPSPDRAERAPRRTATGPQLTARVALSQGSIARRAPGHVFAVVDLDADRRADDVRRAPVAMALVVDVSGSMSGDKIEQARRAVLSTLAAMRDDDRIALVTYSDSARVVQPLARAGDVRSYLEGVVPTLEPIAGTNIPAGLAAGAAALGDASDELVRRVVLVSDGRDGSGQSLDAVANGVRLRADRGVTLSSLGVGSDYDDAYMSRVADAGRGNYEFLREGGQLRAFLGRELDAAARTNVDQAAVDLDLPDGWRVARAYGVEPETHGRRVRLPVGAMSAGEHRRVVLDLAVDPGRGPDAASAGALGVSLSWRAVPERRDVRVAVEALPLATVGDEAAALASRDPAVFADAQSVALAARQQDAVEAWRSGRSAEAERIARSNVVALQALQAAAPSPARAAQITRYNADGASFNQMSAGSAEGRAYGLGSNALHRRAMRSGSGY